MGNHDDASRSALALKLIDAIASEEAAFAELRDQVASSKPSTVPGSTASAGSARDRASASPAKEAPVANKPKAGGKPPARTALATAQAVARKAAAEVARLKAEAAEDDADDVEVEDEDDDADITAEDGADDGDDVDVADETDDDADQTEAEKIAGSPEAAANPKAATAAISAGLTYAQFRKTSAAFAAGGQRKLESTLKGSPRLGADGSQGGRGKVAAGLDPNAIYRRRADRAKGRTT